MKLVFERRRDKSGQAWYRVNVVYRSTEQLRSAEQLTLDNPPMTYPLTFEGIATNEDGMISEADFFKLFDRTLEEYENLEETYQQLPEAT